MKRVSHASSENLIGILFSLSFGIALILLNAGRTSAYSTGLVPDINFISSRIRVQQIYSSQIGVREKQINSGPEVEKYLRYVHLSKGNPWCAAFVCWVFGQAGVENPGTGWSPGLFPEERVIWIKGEAFKIAESGKLKTEIRSGVPYAGTSYTKHNSPTATRCAYRPGGGAGGGSSHLLPTTGDVFGLYFPEKGRIAHVGFVDQWDGTWMISVEGNTNVSGGREGDGVYRKRRLVRTVWKVARYVGS